jgi:hypothetical protein
MSVKFDLDSKIEAKPIHKISVYQYREVTILYDLIL